MNNRLRERLAAGKTVSGIIVFTGSPMVVELAAAGGLDFVILDMEHSPLGPSEAGHLIRAADAAGITPLVRVPGIDGALVNKLLNLGAAGIVLPHADRANCAALLKAMRYPPAGGRGACQITRAARYTRGDWEGYAARANRDALAIALIEDADVLKDFDALAAMPGIDAYFVGPSDLSVALGVGGATFDDPTLGGALDTVIEAARRHGKFAMTLIGNNLDVDYGKRIAGRGVQIMVLGTDVDLFMDSVRRLGALTR